MSTSLDAPAVTLRFVQVRPDDFAAVAAAAELREAARRVDDPERYPTTAEQEALELKYGWDLEPEDRFLCFAEDCDEPVGVLDVQMPERDNRHLVWTSVLVHPDLRRRGYGSAMMTELLRRAEAAGRSTIWVQVPEDDAGGRAFVERFGFRYASHDARRRQVLAEVDTAAVDRLYDEALVKAADYRLERLEPPYDDALLAELVEVTTAINDAPMGELTYEDEVFDLPRLRDLETARIGRRDRMYRVVARHRETGEVGGQTVIVVSPFVPTHAGQGDTAVSRAHRGHRLGLLLKVDMVRWLAEVEPQVETVDTWNNADNDFMISVNESIGYRLSRVFDMYERTAG